MANVARTQEILANLHHSVYAFDEDAAVAWAKVALAEGVDPFQATVEGLSAGMAAAGDAYNRKEYFVPELLICSDALYAGLEVLKPAIAASGRKADVKGSIVLGVVEGDVHDIGKNLVKMMFEVSGWCVYDLGKDVPLDRFVEEHMRTGSDLVGLSALMTTSMLAMPEVIKRLKTQNPNVRVILGGAPLSPELARRYGADGYAKSASTAVEEGTRLLEMSRSTHIR